MNLIGAMLVSLWAAGWAAAAVRAELKARAAAAPNTNARNNENLPEGAIS
jgi:hypothetical protein